MKRNRRLGALSSLLAAWPVCLGCLAAAALLNWAGLALSSVFLLLLGLLGALSRLWGMAALHRVNAALDCARHTLSVGESVTLTYTVENDKLLPLIWLELCQDAPKNGCLEPDGTFSLDRPEAQEAEAEGALPQYRRRLLFLLGHRTLSWDTVWTARRRGVYRLSGVTLHAGDGFGLTQGAARVPLPSAPVLAVYPRPVAVTAGPFLRNVWQGRTGRQGYVEDPTVLRTLRDYQPTDPWKRIDWRMAARQEELQVRLFETVLPSTIHFIADCASFLGLSPENGELEEMLAILSSLLLELDRAGVRCGLSLPGPVDLPARDPALTVSDFLFHIADFDAADPGPLDEGRLTALAQSAGQTWLITHSRARLTCPLLPDALAGQGLGILSWDGAPWPRCRVLSLSSLKIGGGAA